MEKAKADAKADKKAKKGADKAAGTQIATGEAARDPNYVPRMKKRYNEVIKPELMKEFGYKNPMQVPRLEKIVINMGVGEAVADSKKIQAAADELTRITGQRPVVTKAKKSIATFKLREGQKIGSMVTLRRDRMWEFLDRLVNLALPRVRDFKGVSPKAFDGRGNYSLGIREQIIFPEIYYDSIKEIRGLDVAITTTAETDEQAEALLRSLGLPLATEEQSV